MKSASSDEPSGSQGDCEGQEPCQSEAPLISLDSRFATRMGSSEKGVCDVSQAEGVESATEGRCGEPGRVFPIAWGGRVRSAYAGGASWGGPLLPGLPPNWPPI